MAKRKRVEIASVAPAQEKIPAKRAKSTNDGSTSKESASKSPVEDLTIQIIAGSYDRVLHGITATVKPTGNVEFADSFLFTAHTSAIRAVALSPLSAPVPGQGQKVLLASGSTDERINLYNLSAHPPSRKNQELLSSVAPRPILENSKNRELGTLLHHSSSVTKLVFPTRSKLLSSSEDSTIAITRTRDWSVLSTIKAPIPKAQGRPSGDTAPFGGTPSGVNDFAIHPSMKLMISVSKGERCMRLWNLVTGKKAGVLNFNRDMLQEVGEGRHSTGEGRKVIWGKTEDEDEFAVAFDRDIVVFGMDSVPKCRVMPDTRVKVHDFSYVSVNSETAGSFLTVSTEDGRILFFSTKASDLEKPVSTEKSLSTAKLVAQVGGKEAGVTGRIKATAILETKEKDATALIIVAGSSDGKVRLFKISAKELTPGKSVDNSKQAGKLLGTYDTQNRITCVTAFAMIPRPAGVEESEDELESDSEKNSEDEDDDE